MGNKDMSNLVLLIDETIKLTQKLMSNESCCETISIIQDVALEDNIDSSNHKELNKKINEIVGRLMKMEQSKYAKIMKDFISKISNSDSGLEYYSICIDALECLKEKLNNEFS